MTATTAGALADEIVFFMRKMDTISITETGAKHLLSRAETFIRNSAPQETRGDERTATITECINVKVLLTNLGGRSDDWIRGFDAGTNAYIDALENLRTLATTLRGAGIASATSQQSPRLEREGIIQIIEEKMLDAWNTICSDTDCHPMDIEQLGRRKIGFHNSHWSQFTAEMSAEAILALLSPDTSVVSSTDRGGES